MCHGESSSAVNRATKTERSCLKIHLQYTVIQCLCAFDHAGMKVANYEISGLKIRLGRLLFSHEEIKERLKLQKCPAILPGDLACLHGTLSYWVRTMTTEPCAFHFSNPIFH